MTVMSSMAKKESASLGKGKFGMDGELISMYGTSKTPVRSTEKVEKRIASVLVKLAEKSPADNRGLSEIEFQVTRQEIAEMVGASVETCIRTIREFEKKGMVKSSGRKIRVKSEVLKAFLHNHDHK